MPLSKEMILEAFSDADYAADDETRSGIGLSFITKLNNNYMIMQKPEICLPMDYGSGIFSRSNFSSSILGSRKFFRE